MEAAQPRMLVVFDFDWSLVEENSDTWVLDQLEAIAIFKRLKATGKPILLLVSMFFFQTILAGFVL